MNKVIEIERTRKDLSALSGLIFFDDLLGKLNLSNRLAGLLPTYQVKKKLLPKQKFMTGILSFIAGAECVQDIDSLRDEYLFCQLTDGAMASNTMHNFLGKFKLKHFEKLQSFLPQIAFELRSKMFPKSKEITITMDATPHEQHGQYMEGVEWDYKSRWCYSSQNAFDEKGFCYGWNLMKGSAHSNTGAVEMIEKIFAKIPKDLKRFFRADSAYGSHKVYNSLINNGVHFGICLRETVWGAILKENENKMKWNKTRIRFFDSSKCQISSTIYAPKNLRGKSFLRVVFIRAPKVKITKEDKRAYRHYAIVTDMSSREMSDEEVIKFYRGRGNAENFIKDLKNGIDFKHFPCQKMNKNKAWGFMGIFAYNFMRFASFIIDKNRGCFMKRVRHKMVYLASEIRKGQRKIKLRFSDHIYQEVQRLNERIHKLFTQVYYRSGFKT